jgi:hypothetical protein
MHHMARRNPPTPSKRLSITLPLPLHATLAELARLQRITLSRAIVEWLTDTQDALETMTALLRDVRERPAEAVTKLERAAATLQVLADETIAEVRTRAGGGGAGAPQAPGAASTPPASNTGGYLTPSRKKGRRQ